MQITNICAHVSFIVPDMYLLHMKDKKYVFTAYGMKDYIVKNLNFL